MEKPLKFCLQFSKKDKEQVRVGKLLEQMGRHKSAFLTKAVIFYLNKNSFALIAKDIISITKKRVKNNALTKKEGKESLVKNPSESSLVLDNSPYEIPDKSEVFKDESDEKTNKNKPSFETSQENSGKEKNDQELSNLLDGLKLFDK